MKMVATRRSGCLQGILTLGLVVLLIAATTGWFVARSEGFRALAAEQLSEKLGIPVEIGKSYIGWPYVLVLRGVETKATQPAFDIQIRTLRLSRRLRQWAVSARGVRVVLDVTALSQDLHQVPTALARLADVRYADPLEITRATAHLQSRLRISLQDVDVYWMNDDGQIDGVVRQLQFEMQPVRLPSGDMTYYRLAFPTLGEPTFGAMQDLDWEWLTRGANHYIELQRSGVPEQPFFYDDEGFVR